MAIPKYNELYGTILKYLSDGQVHTYKEMKTDLIRILGITDEERALLLPSGKISVFDNRVGWARTYLKKAGLINNPSRAKYAISDAGRAALPDADSIDNDYLTRYDSFKEFINKGNEQDQQTSNSESPDEILENAFNTINSALADDLMTEIMKLTPTGFEQLVVDLLTKMGYGGGIEDSGTVTPPSNDGGIDGIIREDPLGFDMIYIQAKQWALDRTVDRPQIDTFIGALTRNRANKGLFITTTTFSSGAKEAANAANIVLVDGEGLTKLMIEYDLGVSLSHSYNVKKLDSDFFTDFE